MDFRDRRALKQEAGQRLDSANYDPGKLILIHTGASALLMLVLMVSSQVLQGQISSTGGLSGMGLRSILTTLVSLVEIAGNLVLPFWTMGYLYAMLQIARGEYVAPASLLEGFRRFFPVLRLKALQYLLYLGVAIVCFYPAIFLFVLTPLSQPLMDILMSVTTADGMLDSAMLMEEGVMSALTDAAIPLIIFYLVVYAIVCLPLSYRFRMADYALLDDPKGRAWAAMRNSSRLMKGNCFSLLKLDLSFWWYYVLEVLLMVLCYGDQLLAALGVTLPISADTAYFVFYIAYLLAQLGIYYLVKNKVEVTYAVGYNVLRQAKLAEQSENTPVQTNRQPWNY